MQAVIYGVKKMLSSGAVPFEVDFDTNEKSQIDKSDDLKISQAILPAVIHFSPANELQDSWLLICTNLLYNDFNREELLTIISERIVLIQKEDEQSGAQFICQLSKIFLDTKINFISNPMLNALSEMKLGTTDETKLAILEQRKQAELANIKKEIQANIKKELEKKPLDSWQRFNELLIERLAKDSRYYHDLKDAFFIAMLSKGIKTAENTLNRDKNTHHAGLVNGSSTLNSRPRNVFIAPDYSSTPSLTVISSSSLAANTSGTSTNTATAPIERSLQTPAPLTHIYPPLTEPLLRASTPLRSAHSTRAAPSNQHLMRTSILTSLIAIGILILANASTSAVLLTTFYILTGLESYRFIRKSLAKKQLNNELFNGKFVKDELSQKIKPSPATLPCPFFKMGKKAEKNWGGYFLSFKCFPTYIPFTEANRQFNIGRYATELSKNNKRNLT